MNDINPKNLLWMDLEMTGLEPATDLIVEVAVILTNFDLNQLVTYETGVKQDETLMRTLYYKNEWSRNRPAETEAEIQKSLQGKYQSLVEDEIMGLIKQYFGDDPVYLAGNSIHTDRIFIKQYWPKLHGRLHYRMLDVSSFKLWHLGNGGEPFVKKEAHTALSDIQESIAELKSYTNK